MTDKPTPTTDLLKRCAEIHEWRSTGVLSGEALRDYAKRKWPDRHDTLQMAEHETVTEALALLEKWGQPSGAGEAAEHYRNAIASACEGWTMPDGLRKHLETALWSLPTQAQAGVVPLTDEQLAEMMRDTWGCASIAPRHALEFARAVERAHGITQKGGQHGTE